MVPTPLEIDLVGKNIVITWSPADRRSYSFSFLRLNCPCATCRDEVTGERLIKEVPLDIRVLDIREVGSYALGMTFSDRHSTGIFSWDWLYQLLEPRESEIDRK